MKEYEAIDSLYDFTIIIKTWHFENSYLIILYKCLFDLPRSLIFNKECTYELSIQCKCSV